MPTTGSTAPAPSPATPPAGETDFSAKEAATKAASDEATNANLDGSIRAAKARAMGAKLASGKTQQTEAAKGI
jgi:hypothetical protein